MQRVCFLLQVKRDRLEEYTARHEAVWPEMLDALRKTGWRNYSLFLRPDGLLIGYLETDNFDEAVRGMQNYPVNDRWQREMAQYFEGAEAGHADERMAPLKEVFHLD